MLPLDISTPPSVFIAMFVHYQVFGTKKGFTPEMFGAGKIHFETKLQRQRWNRALFIFYNTLLARVLKMRIEAEVSYEQNKSSISTAATIIPQYDNPLILINGSWIRQPMSKDCKAGYSLMMSLVDLMWGVNMASLLGTLQADIVMRGLQRSKARWKGSILMDPRSQTLAIGGSSPHLEFFDPSQDQHR